MTTHNHDYDPYIAQAYKDDAEAAKEKGDELAANGKDAEAARRYEVAAEAYEDYQDETGKDRGRKISSLRAKAEQLRSDASTNGGDQSGSVSSEAADLRKRIETFITTTDVSWDDIGGLRETKDQIAHELGLGSISGLPDAVQASDRVLLFGPPGTGKTLLASAIASEFDTTFFNVKLGGLLSKWHGESSQMVSLLFEVARDREPSVLFFDEIDALTQARGGESDSTSRRVLNALLSELDGLKKDDDEFLMVIGSSNRPMDIDDAVIRRLPTRVHVPLPDEEAASEIVRIHTIEGDISFEGDPAAFDPEGSINAENIPRAIGRVCVRRQFTGSDIEALCQKAISEMVRNENPDLGNRARKSLVGVEKNSITIRPLRPQDIHTAFDRVTASLSESNIREYQSWAEEYGSG